MTAVSDHIVAIATELPLQKIVTELSADLFSHEPIRNSTHGRYSEKSDEVNSRENRTRNSDLVSSSIKESRTVRKTSNETSSGNINLVCEPFASQQIPSNIDTSSVFVTMICENDKDIQMPCNRVDVGSREAMESALKEKKGPIDMNELLSQIRGKRLPVDGGNSTGRTESSQREPNFNQKLDLKAEFKVDGAKKASGMDEQQEDGKSSATDLQATLVQGNDVKLCFRCNISSSSGIDIRGKMKMRSYALKNRGIRDRH